MGSLICSRDAPLACQMYRKSTGSGKGLQKFLPIPDVVKTERERSQSLIDIGKQKQRPSVFGEIFDSIWLSLLGFFLSTGKQAI